MKKLSIFFLACVAVLSFSACETEDDVVFVVQEPSEDIVFTNTPASEYALTQETSDNLAERFVWNEPALNVQTPISYEVQGSISSDFESVDYSSNTITETNHAVKVGDLYAMAELLGLDNDPNTNGDDGNPNNEGTVYFRVNAFVGDTGSEVISTSETMALSIRIIEITDDGGSSGVEVSPWGIVGSAYNDWGNAGPDAPMYTTSESNVFVAYVFLKDGEMKFRENNDWAVNYGDTGADGTIELDGDNIVTTQGDYKVTLNLNDNTYTIEPFSWGIVGSAYNDWGGNGPDAKTYYDYTTNTFKVGVKLLDGEMKIRFNNEWNQDYGDTGADGTLDAGGDNIVVTAGFYMLSFDLENLTYTIEEAELWGIVGSAWNDWGNAGPDANLTEVNPDIWVISGITLMDGEYKFRINEDWANNLGDTGADGTLEADGDNLMATAGVYSFEIDFSSGTPTYIIR
ncbi:SusE domain-containing protein [Luteirhabdus pelagi]|uniref:SusE domain-containing protein n=1 Tax=Luteirhabdus pelagi TaxID=2792783 RepID=UPI00193932B2|nr:SusF/SusE family outer membrane protein [Luteirhabdus pelagi]